MTIQTTTNVVTYTGTGLATSFAFNFLIPEAGDLVVTLLEIATSIESAAIDPALYTATGIGGAAGGAVEYPLTGAPLPATHKINIKRIIAYTQDLALANQGGFFPESLEEQLDRTTMQVQQVAQAVARALLLPTGSAASATALTQALLLFSASNLTIELATAQTPNAVTVVNFLLIPLNVKRITISFAGISLSGAESLLLQLGDVGGFETSAYSSVSAWVSAASQDVVTSGIGFILTSGGATRTWGGSIVLMNVTGNLWALSGVLGDAVVPFSQMVSGFKTLSAPLDRLRLQSSGTDTFDGGTINIAYEY